MSNRERERERERKMSESSDFHEDFCHVCKAPGDLLCCDTCSLVFHIGCLHPPLKDVPENEWHCPSCVVKMGTQRNSRKRSASETEVEKESIEEYVKKARVSLEVIKQKAQLHAANRKLSLDVDFSKIEEVTPKIARKIIQNGLSRRPLRKVEFEKILTYLKNSRGLSVQEMERIQKYVQIARTELFSKLENLFPSSSPLSSSLGGDEIADVDTTINTTATKVM